jgi:hypothetical protein
VRSGLFGPRGPSYYPEYYSNNHPNIYPKYGDQSNYPNAYNYNLAPSYNYSTASYNYPTASGSPNFYSYQRLPNGYSNAYPSQNYALYPYSRQSPDSFQNLASYNLGYGGNWGKIGIILPSKGLEVILIAILILVALDMIFIRPLKNSNP